MNCLIESDRLRLRKFTLLDAEDFYQMTQDDAIQEYTSYAACTSIEDAEEKISDSYIHGNLTQDFYLVIEEKDTGVMVGAIIATTSIKNNIEVSILIHKDHRCKGYITEALPAFFKLVPKGKSLYFCVDARNEASLKTIKKFPEIVFTSSTKVEGIIYHTFVYEI